MTWLLCGLLLATAAAAPEQHCDASDPHCADTPSQDAATQSRQGRGESQSTTVNMVVFMTTAHDAVGEVRFNATVKTLAALSTAGIKAVVVDASPDVVREVSFYFSPPFFSSSFFGTVPCVNIEYPQ